MRERFSRIPDKFVELHREQIDMLILACMEDRECYRNIAPREPLKSPTNYQDNANEFVTIVQLRAVRMRGEIILIEPADDASSKVIADWSEKHKHTAREEMDWHPFKAHPGRCSWCNTDPQEAAERHEGPHATWCPHFREAQRWAIR